MRHTRLLGGKLIGTMVAFAAAAGSWSNADGYRAGADGSWLRKVPPKDREHANPYAGKEDSIAAGAILYAHSCSSCHGDDGRGVGSRPSLRSGRVHAATDGELYWLLLNGNLGKGMPSWSRLPEPQRWQIIRYVHSLPLE